MILRGLLVNKGAKVPPSVKKAVELKNFSTKLDMQVHEIIELCEETVRIPWRHLTKDHIKPNWKFCIKRSNFIYLGPSLRRCRKEILLFGDL